MSKQIAKLPLAACIAAALLSSYASANELRRIQLLEEQVSVLEEQQAELTRVSNVTVNGFFSVNGGFASNDAGYAGYEGTADYVPETKVGLQGSFQVTENTYLVAQLVARGEQHWQAEMEWAFLSHTFDNDLTLRAGRLRVPLYMYSDYLEVNFAQPWLRPPEEVYAVVPVSSYEGVDFIYTIPFDEAEWQFQAYTGVGSDPDSETGFGTDVDYEGVYGLASTLVYNNFTLRVSYVMTELNSGQAFVPGTNNTVPLVNFTDADTNFLGLGMSYDDGDLLVVAEWTRSQVDASNETTNLTPGVDFNYSGNWQDIDAAYISVAYRFGDFTPYVTYAIMETTDDDERQAAFDASGSLEEGTANKVNQVVFDGERTTYSAGLRYDVNANIALKFDVTYAGDFGDDGTGGLSGNITNTLGNLSGQSNVIEDDTMVYTASLNMVF